VIIVVSEKKKYYKLAQTITNTPLILLWTQMMHLFVNLREDLSFAAEQNHHEATAPEALCRSPRLCEGAQVFESSRITSIRCFCDNKWVHSKERIAPSESF
jgi:hypothetical protein